MTKKEIKSGWVAIDGKATPVEVLMQKEGEFCIGWREIAPNKPWYESTKYDVIPHFDLFPTKEECIKSLTLSRLDELEKTVAYQNSDINKILEMVNKLKKSWLIKLLSMI